MDFSSAFSGVGGHGLSPGFFTLSAEPPVSTRRCCAVAAAVTSRRATPPPGDAQRRRRAQVPRLRFAPVRSPVDRRGGFSGTLLGTGSAMGLKWGVTAAFVLLSASGWMLLIRWRRASVARLAAALGATSRGPSAAGWNDGVAWCARSQFTSDYAPGLLSLSVGYGGRNSFTISPRSQRRWWVPSLLRPAVGSGDAAFDREFSIRSSRPRSASTVAITAPQREAIRALFALGCRQLFFLPPVLQGRWVGRDAVDLPVQLVKAALTALGRIARESPGPFNGPDELVAFLTRTERAVWASAGVFLATFALLGWSLYSYPPLDDRLLYSVLLLSAPGVVLAGAALWLWTRRWIISTGERIAWIAIMIFLTPCASIAIILCANGALDRGPESVHVAPVLSAISTRETGLAAWLIPLPPRCSARFPSWRREGETENAGVDFQVCERLRSEPVLLRVHTKPGRLGYTWVVQAAPESIQRAGSIRGAN